MAGKPLKREAKAAAWWVACVAFGTLGAARRASARHREVGGLAEVRSILVIRLDLLGDLLFTMPAIHALRRSAPEARISALVLPYTAELLHGVSFIDRVIAVDVNRWRNPGEWARGAAWREVKRSLAEVREEPYDLCVSFYGRVGAAFALLSGANHLVGYREEGYPLGFDLGLAGRRYRERRHETEYCLDLVRALGAMGDAKPPRLPVDPAAAERVELLLSEAGIRSGEGVVVLHPGALNMVAKRWLPERWAAAVDRIQMELGRRAVLVGSASELPLAETVRHLMRTPVAVLAGRTSVTELAALLVRSDLFLGGDSGPLHLASALGVPSVAVYGPTDPAITGPLGARARVLRGQTDCAPCYDPSAPSECRRGDHLCMAGVSVDEVFEAAREVLSAGRQVPSDG